MIYKSNISACKCNNYFDTNTLQKGFSKKNKHTEQLTKKGIAQNDALVDEITVRRTYILKVTGTV